MQSWVLGSPPFFPFRRRLILRKWKVFAGWRVAIFSSCLLSHARLWVLKPREWSNGEKKRHHANWDESTCCLCNDSEHGVNLRFFICFVFNIRLYTRKCNVCLIRNTGKLILLFDLTSKQYHSLYCLSSDFYSYSYFAFESRIVTWEMHNKSPKSGFFRLRAFFSFFYSISWFHIQKHTCDATVPTVFSPFFYVNFPSFSLHLKLDIRKRARKTNSRVWCEGNFIF